MECRPRSSRVEPGRVGSSWVERVTQGDAADKVGHSEKPNPIVIWPLTLSTYRLSRIFSPSVFYDLYLPLVSAFVRLEPTFPPLSCVFKKIVTHSTLSNRERLCVGSRIWISRGVVAIRILRLNQSGQPDILTHLVS